MSIFELHLGYGVTHCPVTVISMKLPANIVWASNMYRPANAYITIGISGDYSGQEGFNSNISKTVRGGQKFDKINHS
jgi:hypothetical protein